MRVLQDVEELVDEVLLHFHAIAQAGSINHHEAARRITRCAVRRREGWRRHGRGGSFHGNVVAAIAVDDLAQVEGVEVDARVAAVFGRDVGAVAVGQWQAHAVGLRRGHGAPDLVHQRGDGCDVCLGRCCVTVCARPDLEARVGVTRVGPVVARPGLMWRGLRKGPHGGDGLRLRGEDAHGIGRPNHERPQLGLILGRKRGQHFDDLGEEAIVRARHTGREFVREARQAEEAVGAVEQARHRIERAVGDGLVDQACP